MKKTLFVSDLDGTLLQPDARLSEETRRLLAKALGEGKLFTIATARTPATVASILEGVSLPLSAIVMTGVAFWDPVTGVYSDIEYMARETVEKLIAIYRKNRCATFIYTLPHDIIDMYHIGPLSDIETDLIESRRGNPYKRICISPEEAEAGSFDIPRGLADNLDKVILFYGMQRDALSHRTYEESLRVPGAHPQFYHDFYGPEIGIVEQFSPGATKALAIKRLARRIGADHVVAFGDNINDLPMLREADLAVAVENALPEVKEAADIIIGPNTSDSVARFIANH